MAEWSSSYITDLPDSAFACIDDAGRHYPHHGADGEVDLPHLRNALSRVAQEDTTSCGVAHLRSHASAEDVGEAKSLSAVRFVGRDTIEGLAIPYGGTFAGKDLLGMRRALPAAADLPRPVGAVIVAQDPAQHEDHLVAEMTVGRRPGPRLGPDQAPAHAPRGIGPDLDHADPGSDLGPSSIEEELMRIHRPVASVVTPLLCAVLAVPASCCRCRPVGPAVRDRDRATRCHH